jgi:hypothetical protein
MLSMRHDHSEGTKALTIAALLAILTLSAAYVAQADWTGARARLAVETSHKISHQHHSVCERLGHQQATQAHESCVGELIRLRHWHDELSAAQNESIL